MAASREDVQAPTNIEAREVVEDHQENNCEDEEEDWEEVGEPTPEPDHVMVKLNHDSDDESTADSPRFLENDAKASKSEVANYADGAEAVKERAVDREELIIYRDDDSVDEHISESKPFSVADEEDDLLANYSASDVHRPDNERGLGDFAEYVQARESTANVPLPHVIHEDYLNKTFTDNLGDDTISTTQNEAPVNENKSSEPVELLPFNEEEDVAKASNPEIASGACDSCACNWLRFDDPTITFYWIALIALILAITFRASLYTSVENQAKIFTSSMSIDIPASFINAFSREAAMCEDTCCFSLFILTGDDSAHEMAVRQAMLNVNRWRHVQKIETWSANNLIDWSLGAFDSDHDSVILVKHADTLHTKQVQRAIKYGQRRCRTSRPAHHNKVIVLSTSFGVDRLNDPDEVLSDRFIEDFKQRDWLAVPEIVLNRHGIIHGIRGRRPQRVFEDYLRKHRHHERKESNWRLFSFLPSFWRRRNFSSSVDGPVEALDAWLETKSAAFAWTESARRILANKVQNIRTLTQVTTWLEHQYASWTRNGSCESVLFRSSSSDVKAFNVACSSSMVS